MRSRISEFDGRSDGLTDPRQTRWAALRFAVKYSDSVRAYMRRAASKAIARRSLASAMRWGATDLFDEPIRCRREARSYFIEPNCEIIEEKSRTTGRPCAAPPNEGRQSHPGQTEGN